MRIQTLGLLGIFALSMLLPPFTAEAQQPTKVYRIGLVLTDSPAAAGA
jgi:hypothetical protein